MNTDPEKLSAYRAQLQSGEANWQKAERKNTEVRGPEPSFDSNIPGQSAEFRGANNPELKRVSELQFGDIYRMYEGPDMDKYVQPHQNWRTFVGFKESEHPSSHILTSSRLGKPTDFHYSDILDRRFETMTKEEADENDVAY